MPVSPSGGEAFAKVLAELYGDAAAHLIGIVSERLAQGINERGWAERKLSDILRLRRDSQRFLALLEDQVDASTYQLLADAYAAGVLAAGGPGVTEAMPGIVATNRGAVQAYAAELAGTVKTTHTRILRTTEDIYRRVVSEVAGQGVAGAQTRRQVAARAVSRLAGQGVTGFVDARGRNWELGSYVEMASRTTIGQAHVQGGLDRYRQQGRYLVIVSDAPEECSLCRPYEGRVLSLSGREPPPSDVAGHRYAGTLAAARAAGFMHPNCFPPEVIVSAGATSVRASDARWYEGELVVIHTASGQELPVTPQHPVLTPEGWVAAGQVQVGQRLLRYHGDVERMRFMGPDDQQVAARIGEVHDALRKASQVPPVRVPAAPEQFHGDGGQADVEVVLADGFLEDGLLTGSGERLGDGTLLGGGVGLSQHLRVGAGDQVRLCPRHASNSVMGAGDLGGSLSDRHGRPLPALGLAAGTGHAEPTELGTDFGLSAAESASHFGLREPVGVEAGSFGGPRGVPLLRYPGRTEAHVERIPADSDTGADLLRGLAGQVTPDDVVHVERRQYAGHVHNLQTGGGWFLASSIVVHNCRHSLSAFTPGLTRPPTTATADPAGDADRQRQRALERSVREAKRRVVAAEPFGDTQELRMAKALVRVRQTRLRHFVEDTGRKRLQYRESLGVR